MEKEYLTHDQLTGFENYKYSCKDTSPFSNYVMHPFWNKIVELCPKWIAPNVLTFTGFIFTVVAFSMFTWMDYGFYAASSDQLLPKWAFTVAAVSIFLAYTLDGIDGKQARRTDSSGPLGELFDHGLDSYTASIIPVTVYSIFGRSEKFSVNPLRMYFIMWNILVNFYLSHWEKYNTGVLFLPWSYDITMWGTCILFFVSGIWGQEMWHFTFGGGFTISKIMEIVMYGSALFFNLPVVSWNVYISYRDRTGYMRSLTEAIRPFVSIVIFFVLCMIWVFRSPANIVEADPRALYFLTGTIFSNICCRLIVAQMSSSRCELSNWLLIPTTGVILLSLITKSTRIELGFTYALCTLATFAHLHYAVCVVHQMCRHFRINCFSLSSKMD